MIDQRAQQAIKAIGADLIQQALTSKNVWRSLKAQGNNVKFQFLLPNELAAAVAANKGSQVGKRAKGSPPQNRPKVPERVDPAKLVLPEGVFHADGHPAPQIAIKQLGPVAHGVALISIDDALPYLRSGKVVSNEPLALAVFCHGEQQVDTCLPHTKVAIPCVCIANSEPLLTEVVVVQLGAGFVEKRVISAAISVDQLEVATVKVMVYRDEFSSSWEDFIAAPIKSLVRIFPVLARCSTADCQCDCWHNHEELPVKDPILDVWRRQFLRGGFKPIAAAKAEIFSVCLRIPVAILPPLLTMSGTSGAYTEPRTPDGKEVMAQYVVVWAPKMSQSELSHIRQMNPAAVGLARVGDRRGLRVKAEQAQVIHAVLRPEAAFLPGGPKTQYIAGPFPWGVDRHAICLAFKQAKWEVKALQPTQPIPGKGSMWILQSVEAPPMLIFHMAHGEVVVSKQQQSDPGLKAAMASSIGSAATLQFTESMHQLEERISNAVLARIPTSMEQDDMPDRMNNLETQVKQLMTKHQALEGQFAEFSTQSGKQFASVQQQIQQQSQNFHGQLENQTQSVQAMFEAQMQQIRNLLSKRPRDEAPME